MNKTLIASLNAQISVLKEQISLIDTKGVGPSGTTLQPTAKTSVKSSLNRTKNIEQLLVEVLSQCPQDVQLSVSALDTLNALIDPSSRTTSSVVVNEGDDVHALIKAYEAEHKYAKNPLQTILDAAKKVGLQLECVEVGGKVYQGSRFVKIVDEQVEEQAA